MVPFGDILEQGWAKGKEVWRSNLALRSGSSNRPGATEQESAWGPVLPGWKQEGKVLALVLHRKKPGRGKNRKRRGKRQSGKGRMQSGVEWLEKSKSPRPRHQGNQ